MPRWHALTAVALVTLALTASAFAKDDEDEDKPADPDTAESTLSEKTLKLLPQPFEKVGVKFAVTYVGETLANLTGGIRQGAIYEGRFNFAVDVDFEKLTQQRGLSFHANVFQIHGQGLSRDYVGNLLIVSGIEAQSTTRLYEAWFEQKFAGDRVSVRAGQLAADAEFINSSYAGIFINATFGWPAITALDLPSGGPAPPLAAPGVRLRVKLSDQLTFLAAIFNGDPAGPGSDDPQSRNRYGLNFRVTDPPFGISELQLSYGGGKGSAVLPGSVKLGAWGHAGAFADQRLSSNGLSLADPAASASAAQHRGDFGVYGVFEQSLYQFGSKERDIGVFARVSASPSDRNLVDLYADGGLTFNGPFDARPDDKFGLSAAVARISPVARALDQDYALFTGIPRAIRDYEAVFAATYWANIRDGWVIHPSVQYVRHPGGGALNAALPNGGTPLQDAVVLVLRSIVKF